MKDLLKKKLSPEIFAEVEKALGDDFDYIPRSRLNEVITQRENLKKEADELKGKVAALENDNKEAASWKTKYETESQNWEAEKVKITKDHTISSKLQESQARNVTAVMALIDMTKVGDDLKELSTEIERVKKEAPYLFGDEVPGGTGFKNPGDSGSKGRDSEEELAKRRKAIFGRLV